MAALIPFVELRHREVLHGYGVEIDPEVLDMLDFASNHLQVSPSNLRIIRFNLRT